MVYTAILVLVCSALVAASSLVRTRYRLTALGGFLVILLIICVLSLQPNVFLGGELHWYDRSPYREGLLFFVMLIGMFSRQLSVAFEVYFKERSKLRGSSPQLHLKLDTIDFLYPLLFAAITFGSLIGNVGDKPISVVTLVLSYQNGFFWQTLIHKNTR